MRPRNLKTVRTIKINNGTLVAKMDSDDKIHWFRNDKEMTPNQIKTYKYYDPKIKNYRRLGNIKKSNTIQYLVADSVVSPIYTPSIDKIADIYTANSKNKMDLNKKQAVPFNGEYITLKTKGNMNLADVPINLLDSIAINSGRSNTDFWKNSALVGKESTFGGISRALGKIDSSSQSKGPKELVNNHIYFRDGYKDYLGALERKYNYERAFNDNEKIKAEEDAKNALKRNQFIDRSPKYSKYVFADAFKRYQLSPEKYNPGQGNYISMVNNIEQELRNEKQLQNYWNTRGQEFYRRGQKEGINAMKKGGMLQFLQKGTPKNGITINKTIPEITVVPNKLYLRTHYPVLSKDFPLTGHSEIDAYLNKNPIYDEDDDKVYIDTYRHTYIDKQMSDDGYNLVTNNCADATRCALEDVSGKKMNPYFFTTPGDVLDFFKKNFDVRKDLKRSKVGTNTYYTNISEADFEKIRELHDQQLFANKQRRLEKQLAQKKLAQNKEKYYVK